MRNHSQSPSEAQIASAGPGSQRPQVSIEPSDRRHVFGRLPRSAAALMGAAAIALLAAACSSTPSSSGSNTTATNSAGNTGSGSTNATVKTASSSKFGTILVNSSGMALYMFGGNNGGTVNKCTGSCMAAWPALTVPSGTTPKAGSGVTGTLGVAHQSDGSDQVTYNGQLLYTFTSDAGPGQVSGDGVANFSVVKVSSGSSGSGSGGGSGTSSGGGGGGSGY